MTPARLRLDARAIAAHVDRIGAEIATDHPDGVVLVGVLKGACLFLADLARAIPDVPVQVDFLALSRYAPDSGRVRILKDLDVDVRDRSVVLVEDLVDTGLTLAYLTEYVRARNPRSVSICALLDRAPRRIVPLPVRYRGEEIADEFVVGYGLHIGERFRNLSAVYDVDREALRDRPAALAAALYGAGARGGGEG